MSIIFDDDILIHTIAAPGLPGNGFTAPEAATIRDDIDDLMSRPVITSIDDIPNVNAPSPANGEALTYNTSAGEWRSAAVAGPITAQSGGPGSAFSPVVKFDFRTGLTVSPHPDDATLALVTPVYGTAFNTVAMGSHAHPIFPNQHLSFPASGTLSGGTRTLVTGLVTGLTPSSTHVIKGQLYLHMRGDGAGASFTRPRITINTNAKDIFEDSRVVAGVLVTEIAPHEGVSVSGVTSVVVSASVSFQPGDPAYIGGGVLVIEIEANR